ncbi:MAG: DUF4291 domain-containing protein [Deltaproteobacteria bacterium]|nr:DUF4291 domain-containing protein [Deltaproteobacteria bacterium]
MTSLRLELFEAQAARWPASGRHVLAQYDDDTVVVYQAYRPSIGRFAAEHGYFGGEFSLGRMSWIKPNFLWMMYRCGWAAKEGQEVVLAVWLARAAFDDILALAVPSSFDDDRYVDRAAWQADVAGSDVRLQWDPDHDPHGRPVTRRAVQLGLRGDALASYARAQGARETVSRAWIRKIEDVTPFVKEQHARLQRGISMLETPAERVYPCLPTSKVGADARS